MLLQSKYRCKVNSVANAIVNTSADAKVICPWHCCWRHPRSSDWDSRRSRTCPRSGTWKILEWKNIGNNKILEILEKYWTCPRSGTWKILVVKYFRMQDSNWVAFAEWGTWSLIQVYWRWTNVERNCLWVMWKLPSCVCWGTWREIMWTDTKVGKVRVGKGFSCGDSQTWLERQHLA